MRLPTPRGPLSRCIVDRLTATTQLDPATVQHHTDQVDPADVVHDGDLQLALAVCYELHYRGFEEVPDELEWAGDVLAARAVLERALLAGLRALVDPDLLGAGPASRVPERLRELVAEAPGPRLSSYVARRATAEQVRDFLVQRSVYHLKEADPHTWGIPRLAGTAKAALVEVQSDEYGGGRAPRMHATLFATTMRALGLDDRYGAYWDRALPETLAANTTMSLFGLHRRWRGALAGHLAAVEMTSSLPNRAYGTGLRRLGYGPPATDFFDEHVEADAVHEQVACVDLCGGLAAAEPGLVPDILFGAASCLAVDAAAGQALLDRWRAGAGAA